MPLLIKGVPIDVPPKVTRLGIERDIQGIGNAETSARDFGDRIARGLGNGVVKLGLGHFSLRGEGWGNSENSSPQDERG
ncbi:MAG: hypothetical protein IID44_31235 [Planctomycetes bacterium]|nr:hypothetical protein [Planctomycetota bacterium]